MNVKLDGDAWEKTDCHDRSVPMRIIPPSLSLSLEKGTFSPVWSRITNSCVNAVL